MIKKAIHHFNRATIVALEITGVLALILFFAWLGLIWRLSQGPLALGDFVTTHMEQAFHDELPEFSFTMNGAQLVWGGRFQPFEFEMSKVKITRTDKTPVLVVDRLRVQLSKRNLVFGRIVPRVIHIYGPALRVIRQEDGHFTLNVGDDEPAAIPSAPDTSSAPVESREDLVKGLLMQLKEGQGLGLLDGLHEIEISDAVVFYEDKVLDVSYRSTGADVSFARGGSGVVSSLSASLDMGDAPKAAVRVTAAYGWDTGKTTAALAFSGVIPASVAQRSEQMKALSEVDMPLSGSINLGLDPDFRPESMLFALRADAGRFNALSLYDAPVPVHDFYMKGHFDAHDRSGAIDQLKIDIDGPVVDGSATFSMKDGVSDIHAEAVLNNMPIDKVDTYWPQLIAPDPRLWVTEHLSKGTASKATLELEAAYDPAAAEHPLTIGKLGGKIDFAGIRVDYFPPLPAVLDVGGSASYDKASFNLDLAGGKLEDMAVGKSAIHITNLDKMGEGEHSKIDIDVSVDGPLKTALRVLDSEPLKYPEILGIKSKDVDGHADVDVRFKFPIHHGLALHEVQVKATAKLKDVLLKDMVAGMDVAGGPMDLTVDNASMKVKGAARVGGATAQFDWLKHFAKEAPVASRVTATLPLDASTLLKFGLSKDMAPEGTMPTTLTYTQSPDRSATLDLQGDLKPLAFSVPQLGFQKAAGDTGSLAMTALLKDNKPYRITGLDFKAGDAAAKGDVDLATDGGGFGIKKAVLKEFVLGETNISLAVDSRGKDGYDVKVLGKALDASSVFKDSQQPNSDAEAAKPVTPLHVDIAVDRLITGKDKALGGVHIVLDRNGWSRLDRLEMEGQANGKPVSLHYLPQGAGHSLRFEAADAGQTLSILGISNSIRGGKLTVDGKPRADGGPRDMAGVALLENFRLNDAPVVAKLLNAMSLGGILALLNGDGLSFKKARVSFTWTDRGQPAQPENVRVLKLSDGETSGASLGLTFEGKIDQWKNIYDLSGTIIPVSDLNKLLNIIPVVGTILTAGGEGVIAATYTVTGPKEQPDVTVNPLSVLAPGILRKLFFEK